MNNLETKQADNKELELENSKRLENISKLEEENLKTKANQQAINLKDKRSNNQKFNDSLFKLNIEALQSKEIAKQKYNHSLQDINLQTKQTKEEIEAKYDEKRRMQGINNLREVLSMSNKDRPSDIIRKQLEGMSDINSEEDFILNTKIPLGNKHAIEKANLNYKQTLDDLNLKYRQANGQLFAYKDRAETEMNEYKNYLKDFNEILTNFKTKEYASIFDMAYSNSARDKYSADATISSGFWGNTLGAATRGTINFGDRIVNGIATLANGLQYKEVNFFDNLAKYLGYNSIGIQDIMSNHFDITDRISLGMVTNLIFESLPEMLALGGIGGGVTKLASTAFSKSIAKIDSAIVAATAGGNTKLVTALQSMKQSLSKIQNGKGFTSKDWALALGEASANNGISKIGLKTALNMSNIGAKEIIPTTLFGIDILGRTADIASGRGDGANIKFIDFLTALAHAGVDYAGAFAVLGKGSRNIFGRNYLTNSKELWKDNSKLSKLLGATVWTGDRIVDMGIESVGEGLQTYFELQGASNYTLPDLASLLLDKTGRYEKEQKAIKDAAASGGLAAGGISIGASIANKGISTASDVYSSIKSKQAQNNISSEQKTTQAEIDDKYIEKYKDNALVAEPVKKVKDLKDKLSNKEVELTNEKGEKTKTKLTPKVSNEQSKAKLEREINIENKNLQKLTTELQQEKSKATPNQETIKNLEEQIQKSEQSKKDLVETLNDFEKLDNITQSVRSADILDALSKQEGDKILAKNVSKESLNESITKLANATNETERNDAINEILDKINIPQEAKKKLLKDLKKKQKQSSITTSRDANDVTNTTNEAISETLQEQSQQNDSKDTAKQENSDIIDNNTTNIPNDYNDNISLDNDNDTTIKGNVVEDFKNDDDINDMLDEDSNINYEEVTSEKARELFKSLQPEVAMYYLSQAVSRAGKINQSVKELESLYQLTTIDTESDMTNLGLNDSVKYKNNLKDSDKVLTNVSNNLYLLKRDFYTYDLDGNEMHLFIEANGKLSKSISETVDNIKKIFNLSFKSKIDSIITKTQSLNDNPSSKKYREVLGEVREFKNFVDKKFTDMSGDIDLIKLLIATNPNTELSKNLAQFLKTIEIEIKKLDNESKEIVKFLKENKEYTSKDKETAFTNSNESILNRLQSKMSNTFDSVESMLINARNDYDKYSSSIDNGIKKDKENKLTKILKVFNWLNRFFNKIADVFSIAKNTKIQAVLHNIQQAQMLASNSIDFQLAENLTYKSSRLALILDQFNPMLFDLFKFKEDKTTLDTLINTFIATSLKERFAEAEFGPMNEIFKRVTFPIRKNTIFHQNHNKHITQQGVQTLENNVSLYEVLSLPSSAIPKLFTAEEISKIIDKYNSLNPKNKLPAYSAQDTNYFNEDVNRADRIRNLLKFELQNKILSTRSSQLKDDIIVGIKTNQEFIDLISGLAKAGLIVKARQMITNKKPDESKQFLLVSQEYQPFFDLLGIEPSNITNELDSYFWLANFLANTHLSNIYYKDSNEPIMSFKKVDKDSKSKTIKYDTDFIEELESRYGKDIRDLFNELSNDSFEYITNDLKNDFPSSSNIPSYLLSAKKKLEAVRHRIREQDILKYTYKMLGLTKNDLDNIIDYIDKSDYITSSVFEEKKNKYFDAKNNNIYKKNTDEYNNGQNKNNPAMYLPVPFYKKSKFTGKYVREIRYYYMPELLSNPKFISQFKKDLDGTFGNLTDSNYSAFHTRLFNFSEMLYIYGNQQFNKQTNGNKVNYTRFDGNIDFNKQFRIAYSIQPSTRLYSKDNVANSITNKIIRDLAKFKVNGDVNHTYQNVKDFKADNKKYIGSLYGFLQIFGKDIDKLTITNSKEARDAVTSVYEEFRKGNITESQGANQLASITDKYANYIILDKDGNEVDLKQLYDDLLELKPKAIQKFRELTKLYSPQNMNIFDEHPYIAINNQEIFEKYIKSGNIQDLDTSNIKIYADGASTAIFENMIRLEGVDIMNTLARVYTVEMNRDLQKEMLDNAQAITMLNSLSDKIQNKVLDNYLKLLDTLQYPAKELYSDVVSKKGLDPYVLGMAMLQYQMGKLGNVSGNLFASMVSRGEVFDRDAMKKLILPYLYGSTIKAVMIKALTLSIPQNNKALYSLLEEFQNTVEFIDLERNPNNKIATKKEIAIAFTKFLDQKALGITNDIPATIDTVRKALKNSNIYTEETKELLFKYLDLAEANNPNLKIEYFDDENNVNGEHNFSNNTIRINRKLVNNSNLMLETLLHEIIHTTNSKLLADYNSIINNKINILKSLDTNVPQKLNGIRGILIEILQQRKRIKAEENGENINKIVTNSEYIDKLIYKLKELNEFSEKEISSIEFIANGVKNIHTNSDTKKEININNDEIYSKILKIIRPLRQRKDLSNRAKELLNNLEQLSYHRTSWEFISFIMTTPEIINNISDKQDIKINLDEIYNQVAKFKNNQKTPIKQKIQTTPEERIASIYSQWLHDDYENNSKALFTEYDDVFTINKSGKITVNYDALDKNIGDFTEAMKSDITMNRLENGIFAKSLNETMEYMEFFEITNRYTETKFDKNYKRYYSNILDIIAPLGEYSQKRQQSPMYYNFFKRLVNLKNEVINNNNYIIDNTNGSIIIKPNSVLDEEINKYYLEMSKFLIKNDEDYKDKASKFKSNLVNLVTNVYRAYNYTNEFLPEHNPMMNQIVTPDLVVTRESSNKAFIMKNHLQKMITTNLYRVLEQTALETFRRLSPNTEFDPNKDYRNGEKKKRDDRTNWSPFELAMTDAEFAKELNKALREAKENYFNKLIDTTLGIKENAISSLLKEHPSAKDKTQYLENSKKVMKEYIENTRNKMIEYLNKNDQKTFEVEAIIMGMSDSSFSERIYALTDKVKMLPDVLGLFNHNLEAAVMTQLIADGIGLQIFDGFIGTANTIVDALNTWGSSFDITHNEVFDIPSFMQKVMKESYSQSKIFDYSTLSLQEKMDIMNFLDTNIKYLITLSRKTKAKAKNILTKDLASNQEALNGIGEKYDFVYENLANAIDLYRDIYSKLKPSQIVQIDNYETYNVLGNKEINLVSHIINNIPSNQLAESLINSYRGSFINEIKKAQEKSLTRIYNNQVNENNDITVKVKLDYYNNTIFNYTDYSKFKIINLNNIFHTKFGMDLFNIKIKFNEAVNKFTNLSITNKDNTINDIRIINYNYNVRKLMINKVKQLDITEQEKNKIIDNISKTNYFKDFRINEEHILVPSTQEKIELTKEEKKDILKKDIDFIFEIVNNQSLLNEIELANFKRDITRYVQGAEKLGKEIYFINKPIIKNNNDFLEDVYTNNSNELISNGIFDGIIKKFIDKNYKKYRPNFDIRSDFLNSVDKQNLLDIYGNEVSIKGNTQGKMNVEQAEKIINKSEEISLNDFVSLMKENLNNELSNSNLSIEEKQAIEQTYNALIDIVENTGNLKVYQSKEVNSQRGISVANRANRETAIILFDNQHNETPFHEYIHSLLEYAFNETSNEVSAIKNKLYKIKEQVKQELDNNPNLRQELGLSDKDYEYIFNNPEGQDRILHEFLATFLSRPKLAAYLANKSYSPISNRLANIQGNNKIGTFLNGLKALIGILYDLFTLSAFRDRTSMLHLTNRLVRDISQYNTLEGVKAKQLAYENSKLNKANKAVKTFANAVTFKIFMGVDSFTKAKGYNEQDIKELKDGIYITTQEMKNELAKYLNAMENTTSTSKKVLLASIAVLKSLWLSRHIANNPIKRNMVINVLNDFRQRLVEGTFLDFQINIDLGIIVDKGLAKMKNGVDRILSANTSFAIEEENSAVMIRDEIKNIIYSDKFKALNQWIQENRAKDKDFDKKYETALARYIYNLKLSDYFYGVNGNISTSELQSLISRALNRGDNIVKANYKEIDYNINYIMQIIENNNVLSKEMKDKFTAFLYNQTRDLSYTRLSRKHNEIGLQNSEEIFTILNKMYKAETNKELSLGNNKILDNSNYKAIQRKLHQLTTIQTLQMIQTHSNIHDIKYINESMSLVQDAYMNGNEEMQKDIASVITLLTQIHRNSEERNNKKRILNEELAKEYYLQGKNISDRIFLDTQYKTITLKKVANYKDKLNSYLDRGYEVTNETSTEIQIKIPSVYKEVGSFDRDTRSPFYMEGYIPFIRNNSEIDIVKLYTQDGDYDTNLQYYLDKGYTVDLATDDATYLKYKGFANYSSSRARLGFVFEDRIAAGHSHQMFEDFDVEAQGKSEVLSNAHYKKLYKSLGKERTKFNLDSFYGENQSKRLAGSETITRDNISLEALEKLTEPDIRISNLFYSQEHNIFRNNTKDFINNQIFYQIILSNDEVKKRAKGKYSEHHHSIKLFDIVWEDKLYRDTGEVYNAPRIKPNEEILKDYGIKFSRDDLANFYRILKATNYDFNKKGNEAIYVDTRMLPMMFGFEKLTFNDVTKNGKLQKGISHTVTALRGLVKETRNNTIIRNPSLVWENFKSNIVGLIGEGIPLADIFNNIPVVIEQLKEYQSLHREQKSLETRLSALARTRKQDTKIVNDLNEKLANVKRNLKNHPLNYVMENGFYTNIVEDAETEGFKWDNKILDKLQENTNISDETKSYLKDLAMTEDSNTYKFLADFTRLGDFVPRVIYYNHLIGLKGINKSKALDMARDKFVNYNTPLWSKTLRNLDYFGLVNYAKYNFNIQKQILQAFTNSPIQAGSVVGLNVAAKTMGVSPAFMPSNYLVESWLIDGNMPKGLLSGNISMFVNNLNRWNYVTP